MGLKDTISNAVQGGLRALDDIMVTAAVESVTTVVVDASSDVETITSARTVVSAVFMRYTRNEIDGEQVQQQDEKMLFSQASFTGTPSLSDKIHRIVNSASVTYDLISMQQDPASATWTLQLRRRA